MVTIEGNYFDGSGSDGHCILSHRAIVATYTVYVRGNYMTNCTTGYVHFMEDGIPAPFDGVQAYIESNIMLSSVSSHRPVEIQRNLATVRNNTLIGGKFQLGRGDTAFNPTPTGIVVEDNILYETDFTYWDSAPYTLQSCQYNTFFNTSTPPTGCTNTLTSHPLFVEPASDWHLRAGSPALGTGSAGVNRGAYVGPGGGVSLPAWHLPWSAAGALVDGSTCVTQAKALINSWPQRHQCGLCRCGDGDDRIHL